MVTHLKKTEHFFNRVSILRFILANFCTGFLFFLVQARAFSQCPGSQEAYNHVLLVAKDSQLTKSEKLYRIVAFQKKIESCNLVKDSIYAYLLHQIGLLQYTNGNYNEAIKNTLASVQINISGKKNCDRKFTIRSYYNLGLYCSAINRFRDALKYYDLCIRTAKNYKEALALTKTLDCRNNKAHIYYQTGDYQQAIDEAFLGMELAGITKDTSKIVDLLTYKAQAHAALLQFREAVLDINKAIALNKNNNYAAQANIYKIKASISAAENNFDEAKAYSEKAINTRIKRNDTDDLAGDYLDAGNIFRVAAIIKNSGDFTKAKDYYIKSLKFANKKANKAVLTKAINNLAALNFRLKKYSLALAGYHESLMHTVSTYKDSNALINPDYQLCKTISDKNFLSLLLGNKAECLLALFKETAKKPYLDAAIKTALLTDSLINDMRHEQTGEESKLYWRNETREFFTNAIEACYQAKNEKLAFYFMEKSRAVLLNDKLNEIGAAANLPATESAREQKLQINVYAHQQKLAELDEADPAHNAEQIKLLAAREELHQYLKTLNDNYPLYYQYKYDDAIPELPGLQKQIAKNNQSFVHYFITDSAIYILAISPTSSKFIKQHKTSYNAQLSQFLARCSDITGLNNHYDSFALQANNIYQTLFEPLSLPKGRVIICFDGIMIPFEALTTDNNGKNFLINNYSFSYAYSARFLLRKFKNPAGRGNFLGVAPVQYASNLSVLALKESEVSLNKSSAYYNNNKLLINNEANRRNLINQLPYYSIVSILSHARADSSDKEPLIFMADSVVKLSELQLLRNPSTELIVLSACQTNVGKIATGEGILSLARGFASAGIPSIMATLWKADDKTIYDITELFHQNITSGMRKDDALQQAKLSFMQRGSTKNLLPYYWANMVLVGNGDPVMLNEPGKKMWWLGGSVLVIGILLLIFFMRKRARHSVY